MCYVHHLITSMESHKGIMQSHIMRSFHSSPKLAAQSKLHSSNVQLLKDVPKGIRPYFANDILRYSNWENHQNRMDSSFFQVPSGTVSNRKFLRSPESYVHPLGKWERTISCPATCETYPRQEYVYIYIYIFDFEISRYVYVAVYIYINIKSCKHDTVQIFHHLSTMPWMHPQVAQHEIAHHNAPIVSHLPQIYEFSNPRKTITIKKHIEHRISPKSGNELLFAFLFRRYKQDTLWGFPISVRPEKRVGRHLQIADLLQDVCT